MSGLIGGVGSKSGIIGSDRNGIIIWSGTQTATATLTMNQSMDYFNWLTFIHGDSWDCTVIPYSFFNNNTGGYTYGHQLNDYDNEHCYVKWASSTTITFTEGNAGLRRVIAHT